MRRPQVPMTEQEFLVIDQYCRAKHISFAALASLAIEGYMNRNKVGELHEELISARIGIQEPV